MSIPRRVYVNNRSYPVTETPTLLKADLQGQFGWNSVWVISTGDPPYMNLVNAIKRALRGAQ